MMLVAEVFSKAPELGIEAEYFTAIYALLMTAPSRGSEQTVLPVDCLVWEEDRAGDLKLGNLSERCSLPFSSSVIVKSLFFS
jgi:hypothetical protein